jgi:hypothetical protein
VIDDHVGIGSDVVFTKNLDEVLQLGAVAVEGLDCSFLVVVSEVEVIVRVIAGRASLGTFADGRQPDCIDPCLAKLRSFFGQEVPPFALFLFLDRAILIECLHHNGHDYVLPFVSAPEAFPAFEGVSA